MENNCIISWELIERAYKEHGPTVFHADFTCAVTLLWLKFWSLVILCYHLWQYFATNYIGWIDFGQHLIIFFYSNQLLLICNGFWCIHNPTNIEWYNLYLLLLLTFLFLCIILYQNQLVGHKRLFHWWWLYNH